MKDLYDIYEGSKSRNSLTTPPTTIYPLNLTNLAKVYNDMNVTQGGNIMFPAYGFGKYLLVNKDICRKVPHINIVTIVHTAPKNFKQRVLMRETFANASFFLPNEIRIVFLLGKSKEADVQLKMESEHAQFNDTVMGDFYDDYHNLTLKGTMGFHWISEYCPNSDVIVKIDDDVIIDTYKILQMYNDHMEGKQKSIYCNIHAKNGLVFREGKWSVEQSLFPNHKSFPYYWCSGFAVVMTSDLAGPLYQAAKVSPFFWIDDAHLFGILPKVVGGVTFHSCPSDVNVTLRGGKWFTDCLGNLGRDCGMFASSANLENYKDLWN